MFGVMWSLSVRRTVLKPTFLFGTSNVSKIQIRWKKPIDSAQTRLENRTLDPKLDKLMNKHRKLKVVLKLHEIMSKRRSARHVSVEMLSRWRNIAGLNVRIGNYLRRSPHIFEVYTHPIKKYPCCRMTRKMQFLIREEARAVRKETNLAVMKLKKILMMSTSGILHVHALWLVRRELGLPDNFRRSILAKHPETFRMVTPEIVGLVSKDENLAVAEVEKWREKEYQEKWLNEFETKYAFPIQFPTGFKIEKGFKEKLKNWQKLQYLKPYDRSDIVRIKTCGGAERYEKRAVSIIHELLSLTVEKMVAVERLAHFRRDLSMNLNVRELLLKHPGIFYISTRASIQTVFLREAYSKGSLIQMNPICSVREKMLEIVSMGHRNIRKPLKLDESGKEIEHLVPEDAVKSSTTDGDGWMIQILQRCKNPTI